MLDYSIHYLEPVNLLIAHMRYIGSNYEADMAEIGKSEATQRWWKVSLFPPSISPSRSDMWRRPHEPHSGFQLRLRRSRLEALGDLTTTD